MTEEHNTTNQRDNSHNQNQASRAEDTYSEQSQNTYSTSQNTGMAIMGTIPVLFFVPLLTEYKNEEFVKFHVKQGLVLLIYSIFVGLANVLFIEIPIIGWLAMIVLDTFGLVCLLIGILNAAQGQTQDLPLIGQFAHKFDF